MRISGTDVHVDVGSGAAVTVEVGVGLEPVGVGDEVGVAVAAAEYAKSTQLYSPNRVVVPGCSSADQNRRPFAAVSV